MYIETEFYEVNNVSDKDKRWGSIVHLSVLVIFLFSFFGLLAPWLIYIANKESNFIKKQAREALNFSFNIIIANILLFLIFKSYLVFIFTVFIFIFAIYNASYAYKLAKKGMNYKYPFIYRFLKDTF